MAARTTLQLTISDPDEIEIIAGFITQEMPFRRDGRWWLASSVRTSRNGMTVWAAEAETPTCGPNRCGKPATHVMTASDGDRVQGFYRCARCAAADEAMAKRVQPWLTVATKEVA